MENRRLNLAEHNSAELLALLGKGVVLVNKLNLSSECQPVELRTGLNHTLCICAAIASLMIDNGYFTEVEYLEEVNKFLSKDVAEYEAYINKRTGQNIKLKE